MWDYRYSIYLALLCIQPLVGFNRSLFFRTSSFWDETRFERSLLTSLDIQLLGGSSHKGSNGSGATTNILSIYGPEHRDVIAADSSLKLPKKFFFQGVIDVFEADFNFYHNFSQGFFSHFHLPALLVRTIPSGCIKASHHKRYKHYHPAWQMNLSALTPFLNEFDLSAFGSKEGGLSDSTLFIGWTHSFDSTCYFDFIDTTIKTGILFPTGKKKDENLLFDIPFGYNGHWAFPFSWDISLGAFEWFTWGFHSDCLFFLERHQCLRMKTCEEAPCGLITRLKGLAEVHPGIVWRLGTYFKADHIYKGLSFLLAFSYEQSNKARVIPFRVSEFPLRHVNNDPRFQKWSRSIVHLGIEYDYTSLRRTRGTRFGLFYDLQMTGLRVFNVNTLGGYLGIDVNWCF